MDYKIDDYEKSLVQSVEMCDIAIKHNLNVEEAKSLRIEFSKRLYEYNEYKKSLNKNKK